MAKFLNTSATNYFLEELVKGARERLLIISPFLKFNERIREFLADKNRLKLDVRIVYGKSELAPQEINWLGSLEFVRTSFCANLHAKCYMNERQAIITSMNLYEFSQVNNNEMGVLVDRETDAELYRDAYEEAQRLVRISEQVRLAADRVDEPVAKAEEPQESEAQEFAKLTTAKLAKSLGLKTGELNERLVAKGYLERDGELFRITEAGRRVGGEFRVSKQFGPFFLWPKDLKF